MLAAARTAAITIGAGVKGSIKRHEIVAWNRAAQASHSILSVEMYFMSIPWRQECRKQAQES